MSVLHAVVLNGKYSRKIMSGCGLKESCLRETFYPSCLSSLKRALLFAGKICFVLGSVVYFVSFWSAEELHTKPMTQ